MRTISTVIAIWALVGCSSSNNVEHDNNVIDLTNSNIPTEQYWQVSRSMIPIYPFKAAKKGVSGCVEFELVISSEGRVSEFQIIKSVPNEVFDLAARKALRKYEWKPASNNQSRHSIRTTFKLDFSVEPFKPVLECI
ncbi:energy transducer TonB [Pseudoalteromonas luteoviolacea]|uniref:Protein TonB n=1 Tax=Pseudoalteromonas luteoviolacea H33 TaxID=1365251 RepID=A0A167G1Z3_9GAMM|nr:energy transducer TonB [Pseudoalteromonas luteoviolacea]KZN53866.1 hypothetical protein N476_26510 [Pseudoalteromonas luteoviolacea H33]KZN74608.1 hypothetical protein N477_21510 [Pseudoalteromonas luteoviolacea H33-S]MBQ4880033.1 energy transducer TonB [Pseudoalteromonas luteoviolacea]MBQ4909050.1 energy transducer TonB [Pseudoalteromonas luteoviolacea]